MVSVSPVRAAKPPVPLADTVLVKVIAEAAAISVPPLRPTVPLGRKAETPSTTPPSRSVDPAYESMRVLGARFSTVPGPA